jgi:uncharacterized protein YjiS (DUF1127 family)
LISGGPIGFGFLQPEKEVFAMVTGSKHDPSASAAGAVANPLGRLAAGLLGGLVLWVRGLHTRHELMRLDDRALADIGITRDQVASYARSSDPWRQLPKAAVGALAFRALAERLGAWRDRRRLEAQTYRELMAHSDRELLDLGISRGEIRTIARGDGRPWPA